MSGLIRDRNGCWLYDFAKLVDNYFQVECWNVICDLQAI